MTLTKSSVQVKATAKKMQQNENVQFSVFKLTGSKVNTYRYSFVPTEKIIANVPSFFIDFQFPYHQDITAEFFNLDESKSNPVYKATLNVEGLKEPHINISMVRIPDNCPEGKERDFVNALNELVKSKLKWQRIEISNEENMEGHLPLWGPYYKLKDVKQICGKIAKTLNEIESLALNLLTQI
ncbi:MAG: hypothetical protein ACM3NR_04455 [Methanosarcina sp.]